MDGKTFFDSLHWIDLLAFSIGWIVILCGISSIMTIILWLLLGFGRAINVLIWAKLACLYDRESKWVETYAWNLDVRFIYRLVAWITRCPYEEGERRKMRLYKADLLISYFRFLPK